MWLALMFSFLMTITTDYFALVQFLNEYINGNCPIDQGAYVGSFVLRFDVIKFQDMLWKTFTTVGAYAPFPFVSKTAEQVPMLFPVYHTPLYTVVRIVFRFLERSQRRSSSERFS